MEMPNNHIISESDIYKVGGLINDGCDTKSPSQQQMIPLACVVHGGTHL